MLDKAAPHQAARTFPQGVNTSTKDGQAAIWRERCLLWQEQGVACALAYFTFIADVTTLSRDCRFAGDSRTLAVRYDGLPFTAIAFQIHLTHCQVEGLVPDSGLLRLREFSPTEE